MATISVEYLLVNGFLDDELSRIAGKRCCSSGCWVASSPPERDIQWEFDSREKALEVARKMRDVEGVSLVTVDGEEITASV